jgi:hypothetical protein
MPTMRAKSFAARMAALEALEAERQQQPANGLPDLATWDDSMVLWNAILCMRHGRLCDGRGLKATCETRVVTVYATAFGGPLYPWLCELAERAQPLIDAHPRPFIPLASWEVDEAINLIDADKIFAKPMFQGQWSHELRAFVGGSHYSLWDRGIDRGSDAHACACAVSYAVRLWGWQQGYPVDAHPFEGNNDWEMTTTQAWRDWLVRVQEGV